MTTFYRLVQITPAHGGFGEYDSSPYDELWADRSDLLGECGDYVDLDDLDDEDDQPEDIRGRIRDEPPWVYAASEPDGWRYFGIDEVEMAECEHCAANGIITGGEVAARWVDGDGVRDATDTWVCRECLAAGATGGPGYVLAAQYTADVEEAGRAEETLLQNAAMAVEQVVRPAYTLENGALGTDCPVLTDEWEITDGRWSEAVDPHTAARAVEIARKWVRDCCL